MKALVTGALGFVGHHLTEHLLSHGDEVIGVDRHEGGVDITDAAAVQALLERVKPDVMLPPRRMGRRRRIVAALRSRPSGPMRRAR